MENKVKLPVFGVKMIVYLVSELTKRQLESLSKLVKASEYKINSVAFMKTLVRKHNEREKITFMITAKKTKISRIKQELCKIY